MSITEHIVLFSFLFLFYFFWGKKNYAIDKKGDFWFFAFFPIICYALIVGTRYGWGTDYIGYRGRYEHPARIQDTEIGFRILNYTISFLGFDYVGAFVIYSLIFVVCGFVLLRGYKEDSKYMYGLFVPATLLFVTTLIRQGIASGFVLVFIYYLNEKKWFPLFISLMLAVSIHSVAAATIFPILIFYFAFNKSLNWKVTIPLYCFFAFFFDNSKVGVIAPLIQSLPLTSNFQIYADNSDIWFGADAANKELYEQGIVGLVSSSLFYISCIYLGYMALKYKPNKKIGYIYNVFVVGIIFYRIVFLFELLRRFAEPLEMLYFIPLGYAIYVFTTLKKDTTLMSSLEEAGIIKDRRLVFRAYNLCLFFVSLYLVLFWVRFIFFNPTALFFWNK